MDIKSFFKNKKVLYIGGGVVVVGLLVLAFRNRNTSQSIQYAPSADDSLTPTTTGGESGSGIDTSFLDSIAAGNSALIDAFNTGNASLNQALSDQNKALYDSLRQQSSEYMSALGSFASSVSYPTVSYPPEYDPSLFNRQALQDDIAQQVGYSPVNNPSPQPTIVPNTSSVAVVATTAKQPSNPYTNQITYLNNQRQIGVDTGNAGLVSWANAQLRNEYASATGSKSSTQKATVASGSTAIKSSTTPAKTTTTNKPVASSTANKTTVQATTSAAKTQADAKKEKEKKLINERTYNYNKLAEAKTAESKQYFQKTINSLDRQIKAL